jgi:methionyl-tRNA formyltransferase
MGIRIVFMGTPAFAVFSLKKLVAAREHIVAVITAPDKPQGRGKKIGMSAVKEYALSQNLPILQPSNLKNDDFIRTLKELRADLQIVVAFRMLPEIIWSMPKSGSINLHASLLPQYRGAAPINWVLINGENETGVTTFFLNKEIDTGEIIFQEKEQITTDDNAESLHDRLMEKGAELVLKTLRAISSNTISTLPQLSVKELKIAPKIFKEQCEINWRQSAHEIHDFIRGLSPYPAAWTYLKEEVVKIYKINQTSQKNLEPGEFKSDGKTFLEVGTLTHNISVISLHLQGKKKLSIQEFLRGYRYFNTSLD